MGKDARKYLWIAFVAVGILSIALGVSRGEADVVFIKATNLCMECIGLG